MRKYVSLALLLVSFVVSAGWAAPGKVEMKTHTTTVAKAKLTVVHFGAPW